jgi:hypothetical protein
MKKKYKHITDRKLLKAIYGMYYLEFIKDHKGSRDSKIYVPIDCTKIGERLGLDPEIVFGRLYYYLDEKYGYETKDEKEVHLFAFQIGDDHKAINFPMLSAIISDLEESHIRFTAPLFISIVAFLVSLAAWIL